MSWKILVFGRNGQVGEALTRAPWPDGWLVRVLDRQQADLADAGRLAEIILELQPDLVVNAAAYTAVDKAESEAAAAYAVNARAPAVMAEACARLDIPFITFSTDYVFDGAAADEYLEDDLVCPLSVYGASKAEGERLVSLRHPSHLILRTSWVYSATGGNFVRTMLRLGAERPALSVVADQIGKPTAAEDLALTVIRLAEALRSGEARYGVYHAAGEGAASWHAFAEAIFEGAAQRGARIPERVRPITTADYPTPAVRPRNSRLATGKLARDYGVTLRPWRTALDAVLDELLGTRALAMES